METQIVTLELNPNLAKTQTLLQTLILTLKNVPINEK